MFNTGCFYNIANTGMDADIGEMYLNGMFPNTQSMDGYIPGVTGTMNGININGSPARDTFQYEQNKKRGHGLSMVSKFLLGVLAVCGVVLTLRGIKNGTLNLWGKFKGLFKKNKD